MGQGGAGRRGGGPVGEQPSRAAGPPLLFERVLPLHSPSQLGVSPSQPRRPVCTPRAASGRPCGVTRSTATGRIAVEAPQTRLQAEATVWAPSSPPPLSHR